jgi:hypothetical protein
MYYITYYYLNSLSITDCNILKNIPRKNIFQNTPKRKSSIRHWVLDSYTVLISDAVEGIYGVYAPSNFIIMRVPSTKIMVRRYADHEQDILTLPSK